VIQDHGRGRPGGNPGFQQAGIIQAIASNNLHRNLGENTADG